MRRKILALILILTFILTCQSGLVTVANEIIDEENFYNSDIINQDEYIEINANDAKMEFTSKAVVLMEAQTGKVLFKKDEHKQLPIASTTKIMTALLTLESGNIDEYFTVDDKAIMVEGSSMGLLKGDKVTKRGLAYGMMLASGNDGANAAAVKLSGSLPLFSDLMNKRAREIGMKNSNFITPSGLDAKTHYSSAYDMALLSKEAIKNPNFKEICSKITASIEYGNPPYKRWLKNHHRMLKEYEGCIGIKTGFTKKSGRCLVTAAERDGVTLIAVVLNAPNDWSETRRLFEYGFEKVKLEQTQIDVSDIQIKITGGKQSSTGVTLEKPLMIPIINNEKQKHENIITHRRFQYAPIAKGDIIGEINCEINGEIVATAALLANENVERNITEIKISLWEKIKNLFK